MQIIAHVCCGPCAIYPLHWLKERQYEVTGYFFNPNIHPYREFKKRLAALQLLETHLHFKLHPDKEYGLTEFLRTVVFKEKQRCSLCVGMRLEQTARFARSCNHQFFTTTLLYSKFQNHHYIKKLGFEIAEQYNLTFVYHDFREGWQFGIDESVRMQLYRQSYCGCIYSEQERYDKSFRKKLKAGSDMIQS